MVTDFVISTIQYMEKNLQVEAIGAIVIIALILLAVMAVLSLVFRGVRLWYWKTNRQLDTLENIDKSLSEIKENLWIGADRKEQATLPETAAEQCETQSVNDVHIEGLAETTEEELQTEAPKMVFDMEEENEKQKIKQGYNIGKNGLIYSEDILREQIQF